MTILFVRISDYSDSWKQGNLLPAAYNGIHAWPILESDLRNVQSAVYPDTVEVVNISAGDRVIGLLFSEVDEWVTGLDSAKKRWGLFTKVNPVLPTIHAWDSSMTSFVNDDGCFITEWQVIIQKG